MIKDYYRAAYRQIEYISKNGCTNVRCRKCVMKKLCDHNPAHSQFLATRCIQTIKEGLTIAK